MKCFVTGGAGFIGAELVAQLLKEGNQVTVYDNMSTGEFVEEFKGNKNYKFVKGDLLDLEKLKETMKGNDFIWHIAANADVRFGVERTRIDLEQGTIATYNVLEAMRVNEIKNIAFSSSSVVYGEAKQIPTPEDYGPLLPISLYGASKLAAEGLISAFSNSFGMTAYIFRFANIIGKRGTHGILVDFLKKIKQNPKELQVLGDGSQRKSYLLVEDCVDAMLYIVKHGKERINVYNLGGPDQISVKEITDTFVKETGFKGKVVYTGGKRGWVGDVPQMFLDVSKLNKFGWKSKHSSKEAIVTALKFLLAKK